MDSRIGLMGFKFAPKSEISSIVAGWHVHDRRYVLDVLVSLVGM